MSGCYTGMVILTLYCKHCGADGPWSVCITPIVRVPGKHYSVIDAKLNMEAETDSACHFLTVWANQCVISLSVFADSIGSVLWKGAPASYLQAIEVYNYYTFGPEARLSCMYVCPKGPRWFVAIGVGRGEHLN